MNIFRIHIIFILVIITGITACEVETGWNIENATPQLVVDAILTNENTGQVIYLYHTHQNLNDERVVVTNAQVELINENSSYSFSEESPGKYTCPFFELNFNSTYQLIIQIDNFCDTAFAKPAISPDLVGYKIENKSDSLYVLEINEYPINNIAYMSRIYYNWENSPEFCDYYGNIEAIQYYYFLNNTDVVKEFGPDQQSIFFPSGTIITRKQYGLSAAHAQFLRSFLIETDWRGGLFDMEQANLPGNFKNGTLGWFAVCDVKSDTIFIP